MKTLAIILLTVTMLLAGCVSADRQQGGHIEVEGNVGSLVVDQPENAKEDATADYKEDGITIPVSPGDHLAINIVKDPNGAVETSIVFEPVSPSKVDISSIIATANSGASHKDIVGELNVFMKNSQVIMYVGMGFLVVGGLSLAFLPNKRTGLIFGGIGALLLGAWAILPQIYSNWGLVLICGVGLIPAYWLYDSLKHKRLLHASIDSHEKLKKTDPVEAKKRSSLFKENIRPEELEYVKKIRDERKRKKR